MLTVAADEATATFPAAGVNSTAAGTAVLNCQLIG